MTGNETKLHRMVEYGAPGLGDAFVRVYRVAAGRTDRLHMAISIRFFFTMGDKQGSFDNIVAAVDKGRAVRKGPKADRHAAALTALREIADALGLTYGVEP